MKIIYSILFVAFLISGCNQRYIESDNEKKEWINLFNGKDLKDWTIKTNYYEVDVDTLNTFRVEDGMIRVSYEKYENDFKDRFSHLYYKQPFSYYHLMIEYRFIGKFEETAPSFTRLNSGVMLHSQDPKTILKDQPWPIAIELQFLGGLGDGNPRPTCNMCSPGIDVFYKGAIASEHCISSSSKTYEGEQWVTAEAIVLGDSLITYIVNADTVLQFSHLTMGTMGENGDMKYNTSVWQPDKPVTSGYIGLQSKGQPIDFRSVKLLNLEGCMDRKAKNYKSYYIKSNPSSCKY
jgi:hypothetical protein